MTANEFIISLIANVRKRECIWNSESPEYSKKSKLEIAWKEISDEMNAPENVCREKWKNVRTGFLRSFKNSENPKRRKFYLYDVMSFLLPYAYKYYFCNDQSSGNVTDVSFENDDECETNYFIPEAIEIDDSNELPPLSIHVTDSSNSMNENNNTIQSEEENQNLTKPSESSARLQHQSMMSAGETGEAISPAVLPTSSTIDTATKSTITDNPPDNDEHDHEKKNLCFEVEEILNYLQSKKSKETSKKYNNEDKRALISFFKGIIPDILSLSSKNQRAFKIKMLEIIQYLHEIEEDQHINGVQMQTIDLVRSNRDTDTTANDIPMN